MQGPLKNLNMYPGRALNLFRCTAMKPKLYTDH